MPKAPARLTGSRVETYHAISASVIAFSCADDQATAAAPRPPADSLTAIPVQTRTRLPIYLTPILREVKAVDSHISFHRASYIVSFYTIIQIA